MRKIFGVLTNRIVLFLIPFMIQLAIVVAVIVLLDGYVVHLFFIMQAVVFLLVIYVVGNKDNPAYKIGWIIILFVVPIYGAIFYIFFGGKNVPKAIRKRNKVVRKVTKGLIEPDYEVLEEITLNDRMSGGQAKYLAWERFPTYKNTETQFLESGEQKWESLLKDLKGAKHHIFLQYFIIREGEFWGSILEILEEKVKEGVDVRVGYDDLGCLPTLPNGYYKVLKEKGIKCYPLNPLRTYRNLTMIQNNRDHRKIVIIDGYIGYTGGINIGDEYVNITSPYGKWRDCAVRLEGKAVWSLTVCFMKNWMLYENPDEDIERFRPEHFMGEEKAVKGFITPYWDSPLDYNNVGENVYINMINCSTEDLYVATPYLILPNEVIKAFKLAARRGVDVKIVTPNIPDKKSVFLLTQSYYKPLLEAGVKVYQYTPGFIHSKTFVSDGKLAVCGTINLDFRSLYLHFENAVWMYKSRAVKEIRADYLKGLEECHEITLSDINKWTWSKRFVQSVLRIFAPLM